MRGRGDEVSAPWHFGQTRGLHFFEFDGEQLVPLVQRETEMVEHAGLDGVGRDAERRFGRCLFSSGVVRPGRELRPVLLTFVDQGDNRS